MTPLFKNFGLASLPPRHFDEIERRTVNSVQIASIGFAAEEGRVQIEYRNGFVYEAFGVMQSEFDRVTNASHFGDAFQEIIGSKYDLVRVGSVFPLGLG